MTCVVYWESDMKNQLTPNASVARAFIEMLAPDGIVTFQTFDDDKARKKQRSRTCISRHA